MSASRSASSAARASSSSSRAAAGPRAPHTSRRAATSSGATSRTTGCCATTRRPAPSACSAQPAGYTNGNTVDRQGRLVTCEHGNRRVTRTEHDGSITVIADRFEGKRLNSPNDVVVEVRRLDLVHRSRPTASTATTRATRPTSEIGACHVYRVDPRRARCRIVADDFVRPNGLAFSPDERRSTSSTPARRTTGRSAHMRVVRRRRRRRADRRRGFADLHRRRCSTASGSTSGPDLDERRRRRALLRPGRHAARQDPRARGCRQRRVRRPKRNRLFICATTSLYAVLLPVNGATHPVRRPRRSAGASARRACSSLEALSRASVRQVSKLSASPMPARRSVLRRPRSARLRGRRRPAASARGRARPPGVAGVGEHVADHRSVARGRHRSRAAPYAGARPGRRSSPSSSDRETGAAAK